MKEYNLKHCEARIKDLSQSLKTLAEDKGLDELMLLIRKPGWTTPAEISFTGGILDSMLEQTKVLAGLKQVLLTGSRAVSAH